jgi:GT2 family glycosyltransferase
VKLKYLLLLSGMKLSIIIINFNTPLVTLECLRSIQNQSAKLNFSYEIILVDNAPVQDYQNQFESSVPNLTYIISEKNIGFGRANNLGMKIANGKYFLLLNSDTLLIDDSLNHSIEYLDKDIEEQIGLLGCTLLNKDRSYQHSFYPFVNRSIFNYFKANNSLLSKIFNVHKHFQEVDTITQVGDVSGAFMLLRKSVFEKTGGFDPDFFLYCEETEWCRNRIAPHFRIIYFPFTKIIHLGGQSAPKEMMYVQSQISLALFWYKTGILNYLLYLFLSFFNVLYSLLIFIPSKKETKNAISRYLRSYVVSLPYLFYEIPRYGRGFHARKSGLVYKPAASVFFPD